MQIIRNIVRFLLPSKGIRRFIRRPNLLFKSLYEKYLILSVEKKHQKTLQRIKGKKTIKVAFFLLHESVWKYEGVYRLMEKNERFDPIVVVCPYMAYGEENMLKDMRKAYNSFRQKRYNVIRTLDENTGEWLDVKKEVKPDIVFFTNPHKLTKDEYYIMNFIDTLTCYVQYSFHITYLHNTQYNQIFHNLLWLAFYETPMHKRFAIEYARNKGRNVRVTGYPGIDRFFDKQYIPEDPWKIKDREVKRIIWAPHHTIEGNGATLDYSNFLQYADFMLDIANKFKDKIQIAFKPHPLLYSKLFNHKVWGKEKTQNYYKIWDMGNNRQLNSSDYVDLFLTSDAMIHDCASFMTEYLCVNKPVLFLNHDDKILDRLNEFGKISYANQYHASNQREILEFIEKIIIKNKDYKENERLDFISKYLTQSNYESASQNIIDYISLCLNNNETRMQNYS